MFILYYRKASYSILYFLVMTSTSKHGWAGGVACVGVGLYVCVWGGGGWGGVAGSIPSFVLLRTCTYYYHRYRAIKSWEDTITAISVCGSISLSSFVRAISPAAVLKQNWYIVGFETKLVYGWFWNKIGICYVLKHTFLWWYVLKRPQGAGFSRRGCLN